MYTTISYDPFCNHQVTRALPLFSPGSASRAARRVRSVLPGTTQPRGRDVRGLWG